MKRTPLLFATPRSGSTPINLILAAYLKKHHDIDFLPEPLNSSMGQIILTEGSLISRPIQEKEMDSLNLLRIRDENFELLKKFKGRYFFKFMPASLAPAQFLWFCENFDLFFLERRDLFQQLLSYLISFETKIWYRENGIFPAEASIRAHRDSFLRFESLILFYESTLKQYQPKHVVVYEDFLADVPKGLERLGMKQGISNLNIVIPTKQNAEHKLVAFENSSEIQKWFADSRILAQASARRES